MPVLNLFVDRYKDEKPFEGMRINICLHIEAKTGCLALALKEMGAEVALAGCNPLSTQDDVAGYIRAAVIVSWENELGVVYAKTPKAGEDYTIEYGTGWEKEGDYYYWPAEVAAGFSTGDLIVTCQPVAGQTPEGYTLVVDILAQIIQSNPKDAVIDAWGYDPGSEG